MQHPRPGFAVKVILVLAVCLFALGCRTNPVTGESEMIFITTENELALGDNYHPNIVFMYDGEYLDPQLKLYLGTIVSRLHATSHRRDMRMDFTVLNTTMYNAFAIPGHVYCTRGFLAQLRNEAQFAAVMGHEIAHVTSMHAARQMTRQVLMMAGLAVVQGSSGNSDGSSLAALAGEVSLALLGLHYSREQEHQADRVGTYYMALAGWDPRQAIEMQKLLASLSKHQMSTTDKYLSTHPPAPERIAEVKAVIQEKALLQKSYVQGDGVFRERWDRWMAKVRQVNKAYKPYDRGSQLAYKGEHAEALKAAEEALRGRTDQAPFHRLKGDALLQLDRLGEARAAYHASLAVDPRYVPANVGLGQLALKQNNFGEAERQFAIAVRGYPSSGLASFGLGVARFRQNKFKEAIPPLQSAASAMPQQGVVHYVLAMCYDQTNQPVEAYVSYYNSVQTGLEGQQKAHAQQRMLVLKPYYDDYVAKQQS